MFTNTQLVKLWSNDQKRKAFIQDYKTWGIWFTQPELKLTFFKYDLPDCTRLIVMEYLRAPYPGEKTDGNSAAITAIKQYIQRGDYFNPSSTSTYQMTDCLKYLKEKLSKELKQDDQRTV